MAITVPDGLEGWLLSAGRCAAHWSYRDLADASGVALSAIQRLEALPLWEINRGPRGRRLAGTVDEETAAAILAAFAKVGLELRPANGRQQASVACVDRNKLAKRHAAERDAREAMKASKG